MKHHLLLFVCFLYIGLTKTQAQLLKEKTVYTHADTLRGSNGPGRDWWNVIKYDLHVKFNIEDSTISGWNLIKLNALKSGNLIQIDLQDPMIIDSIINSTWSSHHFIVDKITKIKKALTCWY